MSSKQWLLFSSCILWSFFLVGSFEDFCEEVHSSIFCTCEIKYMKTIMSCFIHNEMKKDDEIWHEMSDVENVISLKLSPREPDFLDYFPVDTLKRMPYLETIIIQQANLSELQAYSVSGLKVLRELILEGCDITRIEAEAISNLPRLKKLTLSDNLLQEVLSDTLVELLDLEELYLDRNNISRIEGYAFSNLHNLRDLELWDNEITDLTEYMFRGIRYLKRLDLSKNKIRILNDKIFHSLPKLGELDLHGNMINHIAPHAFQGLEKLQILVLHSNNIKMLPDNVFNSLPRLITVNLDKNELETLQVRVLEHIDNIKDPHLSIFFKENPLQCDCRLSWVDKYLRANKSFQFTRELEQLECYPEGENATVVHLLKMDCSDKAGKEKNPVSTSKSVIKHPVDLVPYEIQKRKNKAMSTEPVVNNVIITEDSEMEIEKLEEEEETESSGPSGSGTIREDFHLIVFVTLLTVFLVRRRKGTLF